ncbi:nuclear pore complex protein Nup107 [Rhipicephalus microplus]|uniref:nuclear pore complex protein Nup107 n=1 Tax=Rhipicephalus microplus TaxID=6941 RepID=UPI003F6C651E
MSDDNDRLEYFADEGCAWKNTLHHLQSCADVGNAPSSYVSELNPDAPSRERLQIHDLDREDDCRLFRSVFFHLRPGQLQWAQELVADNGHFWLAAVLEGWRPYHDQNNRSIMGADSIQPTEGNLNRDLWKHGCWEAASNPTSSLYERTVYGALSGNVQAMLPACTTWEKKLWTRMRAMVDVCMEQELRTATQQARSLKLVRLGYPSDRATFEDVFRELQAAVGCSEARDQKITHILQRGVVLDDAVPMVEQIHDWTTTRVNEPPLLTMRFLAHMVLLLRQVGCDTGTEACSALLRTYLDMLINEGHVSLVATYAATLPATDQVAKYTQLAQAQN